MTGRRGGSLLLGALAGLFIGGLILAGPPVTVDDALALRRFLSLSGLDVRAAPTPPQPPGAFVLLQDVRDETQAASLLRWAERGGRLVVLDPGSRVLPLLGVGAGAPIGLVGPRSLVPDCPVPEIVGVREIASDASDLTLQPTDPSAVACFVRPGGSYAVFIRHGEGRVVLFGGSSFLTNDYLDQEDNAVLALRVFGGGRLVVFGPAAPPNVRSSTLWDLLPRQGRLVVIQLAWAGLLFAVARARRLGKPVIEEPIAPIPASELVRATAGLYRRARAAGFCGNLLRSSARERLAGRVGAQRDTAGTELADLLSRSSGVPRDVVERTMLGPDPASDEELLTLAVELSTIAREIEVRR